MLLENIIKKTKNSLIRGTLALSLIASPYLISCGDDSNGNTTSTYNNGSIGSGGNSNDNGDNTDSGQEQEEPQNLGRCSVDDYLCDDFMDNMEYEGPLNNWRWFEGGDGVEQFNGDLIIPNGSYVTHNNAGSASIDYGKSIEEKDFTLDLYFKYQGQPNFLLIVEFQTGEDNEQTIMFASEREDQNNENTYGSYFWCDGINWDQRIYVDVRGENEINHLQVESFNEREDYTIFFNDESLNANCNIDYSSNGDSLWMRTNSTDYPGTTYIDLLDFVAK